jgi:DNA-binding transcriptional ArsR family regulator
MPRDKPEVRRAAELFAVLGHPTRLAVVLLLGESSGPVGPAEIRAEVAPEMRAPSFSTTIGPLASSGLVSRFKRGKEAYYELTAEARGRLGPLFGLLTRSEARR